MGEVSNKKNAEVQGRKFCAVVCACVAGLITATLLTIGLNSAKADVADVTFDDVTINAGAKISLNGTHTLTGLYDNKLLADETNGEEVESADTDAILSSFANDHYESDALANSLKNASLLDVDSLIANRAYITAVDKGYWLLDESYIHGIKTQAWRTATNASETLYKAAQGKTPDGVLYTPAPEWAGEDYVYYKMNGDPKKFIEIEGYDVKDAVKLADCSWAYTTKVWDIDSSEAVTPLEFDTTLTKTIYKGKEIYNNPWCIEDHSRGFYKTTATEAYFYPGLIHGRIEVFEGSETAEAAVFLQSGEHIKTSIEVGDTLLLTGLYSWMFEDITGFLKGSPDNVGRERYSAYFKAEEDGKVTRQHWYLLQDYAYGWHRGVDKTEAVKGQVVEAGMHAVRPSWDARNIAFFRNAESTQELAVSSTCGSAPLKAINNGASVKSVVKSQDVKISFDVSLDNCETDRDAGRNKCTKVEGRTIKVPWKSKELILKNVATENANYVSALVQTSDNKKYGVLVKADGSDVKLDLTNVLFNTLIGDKITVSLYAEKANDAGFSDEISETPVTFQVEVAALAPQRIVYDANGGTGTVPADTVGIAGEQVQIADGSGLISASGTPFQYWELSWETFEQTGTAVRRYHSGDQLVMPDAITYPDCGIITAKAIYAGGIQAEKSTETSGEYYRVVWDSNQGDTFEARVDSVEGDRQKATMFKTKDGVAAISEEGIPDVVNITDGSIYICIGWSKDKNAKIGDDGIFNKSQLKGTVLTDKKTTYYAIWFEYVESYYWLGTKKASAAYVDEEYFAYHDANYYPGTQIKRDMNILHKVEGTTDEQYASTLAKWQQFYENDEVRLYTTYQGGATQPLWNEKGTVNHPENGLCEFRILEVSGYGGHLNTAGDATSGDGSVVTFMTTHLLPKAYALYDALETTGGWKSTPLRNKMLEGGEIYANFNENFSDAVKKVKKKSHPGGSAKPDSGTEYLTDDKFWILSATECNAVTVPEGSAQTALSWSIYEGTPYAYLVSQNVTASSLQNNPCLTLRTRSGGIGGGSYIGLASWFLRSPCGYWGTQNVEVDSSGAIDDSFVENLFDRGIAKVSSIGFCCCF